MVTVSALSALAVVGETEIEEFGPETGPSDAVKVTCAGPTTSLGAGSVWFRMVKFTIWATDERTRKVAVPFAFVAWKGDTG